MPLGLIKRDEDKRHVGSIICLKSSDAFGSLLGGAKGLNQSSRYSLLIHEHPETPIEKETAKQHHQNQQDLICHEVEPL